jgi:hypothetical protein
MHYRIFFSAGILIMLGVEATATSFGRKPSADVATIDDKPAICLPAKEKQVFRLGWLSLSEGAVRSPASWGIALTEGAQPKILNPGDCIVFGTVPDGYESDDQKTNARPLKLEVDRAYIFRMSDAYRPRDTYAVVFLINEALGGALEYIQYSRVVEYGELIPSRDAGHNDNDE